MKRVKITSKNGYFSTYQSPNIVIDPNKSVYPLIAKKMKTDKRVNTNLKILQDNKISELYSKMDSGLVKKINKDDLKNPIKNDISPNKILFNGPNKSNTVKMGENISSKIKLEENFKPDNNQRENVTYQFTSGVILNSNKLCTNNTDLTYKKESSKNNKFNNNIKIEPNNNFDSGMGTSNKEGNCSERTSKLTNCENNKKTVKNEEKTDINKTFKNKVKDTKEDNMPKKIKEATKKNLAQVNRKYPTKDVKQGKNKTGQPRTIKIIINVTYNNLHSKNNTTNSNVDGDLSFLDDFDVDEVVESLFNGKQQNKPIINDEKMTESSKRRKTSNTEQTNTNHKESLKHTSKVDNKTEEIIKSNIEKEKSPADIETEKNKSKNENGQIDCSVVPKNINSKSKSNIISTERKKDSKETKKEVCSKKVKCVDVDHNTNKQNIGHGILNKFVTKLDKDLAHNLEIKMYDTLKQKYSVLAVTHYGKFSKIFKCIGTSGDCYAVKILDNPSTNHLKEKKKENILQELKKDIPEENLRCINLLHSFQIDKHMCYMTNYYPINLEQILIEKKFHIEEIQALAKQLVEAVTVLRSKNIVHYDIKPSHILLDDKAEKLTLCGFDEAILYVHSDNLKTNIGTVNYASPEKILGHSHGFPVDVWSTALVIYEMATNTMLFTGTTDNEVLFKQMSVLGNMPEYIIKESRFRNIHFRGTTFIKKGLNQYSDIRIHNFVKNNNIFSSIIAAQSARDNYVGCENVEFKLQALVRLLGRMLAIDPRKRLTIEYVYADNFFFQKNNLNSVKI